MSNPKVSIIIPIQKKADFFADAIQSALVQTYSNFEIIVAGSRNFIQEIASQYNYPQIKYIFQERDLSRAAVLNIGIKASSGEIIAFLDPDDLFHPEKLQTHIVYFGKHPDISVICNARYEIATTRTIHARWYPPSPLTLSEIVLGLPVTLSDLVVRRNVLYQVNLFDEKFSSCADILDINCRMLLAGSLFGGINRSLTYHRNCAEKDSRNQALSDDGKILVLEATFDNPHCPPKVQFLREKALGKVYLHYSYLAFSQSETFLGQDFLRKSIRLDRSILDMQADKLLSFMILASIEDAGEYPYRLRGILKQLPPELAWITPRRDWAVARGHIHRGVRAIIWGEPDECIKEFTKASDLGAGIDKSFCYSLLDWVKDYEEEFGYSSADKVIRDLIRYLPMVSAPSLLRWLNGVFFVNRAFRDYSKGKYDGVFQAFMKAVLSNPIYLGNRGVLSIMFRSMVRKWRGRSEL